ncbi:hypothetical protein [Neorhizobium sp. NCHU2750]|uniref:hypothetical protein n=1 Tax=Neorhizobium sp. NCHU2750 TaxID=1825976 RepID=UPI000E7176D2|nr:hypothetical protein NCHU2750_07410 [Neorhizobium sp. NCHU2750]
MKIDSGLNGYQYPNRTATVEREQEEAPQIVTPSVSRSQGALTGSSTLLSGSLASALWGMTAGDATPAEAAPQVWVQSLYEEFA